MKLRTSVGTILLAKQVFLKTWLCVFVFICQNSFSQQTIQGIQLTGSNGITLTVDQIMAMEKPTPFTKLRMQREHEAHLHKKNNPDAPEISSFPPSDTAVQNRNDAGNSVNATQTIGASWRGPTLAISGGWIPPDCNGAVGPTQVLVCGNTRIQVYSKAGVLGPLNADITTFFSSVDAGIGVSDTHIRYDRLSGRWFVVTINTAAANNRVCIAVSSGPVITGAASFTFFFFVEPSAGAFFDYPTLGVDANALYIGGNRFSPGYSYSPMYIVRKSSILAAGPIVVTAFNNVGGATSPIYTPQGVDNEDPAATEGYFVGTDVFAWSKLDFVRVNTPGGVPTLTIPTPLTTIPATYAPLTQVHNGTGNNLDALDDRLFAAHVMKNKITGVTTLWTAHNLRVNNAGVASAAGNRNGSRWYQIGSMTTATPTLVQSGTLFDAAAANYRGFWIPSIAMSGQGHAVLGSSTASAANKADVEVSGRYSCDAPGTLQPFSLATASATTYNVQAGTQRWGDYSQVVVDPNDNMTMWAFGEYCDAANDWAVRVVQLIAPPPPPPAVLNPLAAYGCTASNIVTITASSTPNCTGFFDPGPDAGGPGFANRLTASCTGGITVTSVTFVSPTQVTLDLNTSAAATGTYIITITNPDGQTTTRTIDIVCAAPVELLSFTAECKDNKVFSNWQTASEFNNDYFLLERSRDGSVFSPIATVKGTGNSSTIKNYSFTDTDPLQGKTYYRLSQTDFDGSTKTYTPIAVSCGEENNFSLDVNGNPVTDGTINLSVSAAEGSTVLLVLTDVLGREIYSKAIVTASGSSLVILNPEQKLAQGMYSIIASNKDEYLSRKIIVK
ncbi:MAG: T9SS type A sorting domain-containing protein [Bacteroidetes bacterium]|nr:T9SS type A sorting domain-containing protein [Bacteroidota bacterium]